MQVYCQEYRRCYHPFTTVLMFAVGGWEYIFLVLNDSHRHKRINIYVHIKMWINLKRYLDTL